MSVPCRVDGYSYICRSFNNLISHLYEWNIESGTIKMIKQFKAGLEGLTFDINDECYYGVSKGGSRYYTEKWGNEQDEIVYKMYVSLRR